MSTKIPKKILEKYWGYTTFRPLQEEIIDSVLSGNDVLAILPTGAGKSVCYQLPALALGGACLVVSPLIALMQDQVVNLRRLGISAACIHSAMPKGVVNDILDQAISGVFQLLYVAPERLQSEAFLDVLPAMNIRMVAIDEAHCISQWGHDFRPAYLNIVKIRPLLPESIPWVAFTATATHKVQQEILQYLEIPGAKIFRQSIYRQNLAYSVVETEGKLSEIIDLFKKNTGSGILYCPTRKRCMEMKHWFQMNGLKALAYHAGLPKEERFAIQKQWTQSPDTIICATSAFGMGIDKEDVKIVVHLSPPDSLEAYYQEAGRAGRNGQPAKCILLYEPNDILKLKERPSIQYPPKRFVLQVYQFACDYLKIPIGSGAEETFAFDVVRFAKNFSLDLLPCMSAIRILEKSGIWIWEQQNQMPTTIQLLADEHEIQALTRFSPELFQIITALLRLHSGIFTFPVMLKIWDTAKYLNIEQSVLITGLKQLHSMGILTFEQGSEGSFLNFLENRCRTEQLVLDAEKIKKLKKTLALRIREMLAYLENDWECRSLLLGRYFGEHHTQKCGRCDFCREQVSFPIDSLPLKKQIMEILTGASKSTLQTLTLQLPGLSEDRLIQQLRNLQEEGFCRVLSNGTIIKQ